MENGAADRMTTAALSLGAYKAAVISVANVVTDVSFRTLCEQNVCGSYGKNWMCPPDVGEIDELISVLKSFESILVYQTVGQLEDSFDIDGMEEAVRRHRALMLRINEKCDKIPLNKGRMLV